MRGAPAANNGIAMDPALRSDAELERSDVVANSTMNRGRNLAGANSYAKDLGFDIAAFLRGRVAERGRASWLDLCCGEGRALLQAAGLFADEGLAGRVTLVGVDLVPRFAPHEGAPVALHAASLSNWEPSAGAAFDLITCVHGLHYVGDKLALLARAASWLADDGRLRTHLDPAHLRLDAGDAAATVKAVRAAGFGYNARRHLLTRDGRGAPVAFPFRFLGADDAAGPNYTGQPAVLSCYAVG